jgi:7-cyano-7-deazaguanine synthase
MSARAVVLLSGGLDSAVAAALYQRAGNTLAACVFADYGQRAREREAEKAERLARRWGAPWHRVALPWLDELAARTGSRLAAGTGALPAGTASRPGDDASARAVWVPARNAVLVAIAAAFAETLRADAVVAGFNREEAATFPDNGAPFLSAATAMLAHGTRNGVRVESPTLYFDKDGIVAAARELGFTPADVWSCYDGGSEPCGRCESCLRSRWVR